MAKKINVTKEEIIAIMKEEAALLDWGGREIDFDAKLNPFAALYYIFNKPMGMVCANSNVVQLFPENLIENIEGNPALVTALSDNIGGKVIRFINRITGNPGSKEEILRKIIKNIVVHENRHCQQYDFLASKGYDVNSLVELVQKENETYSYEKRPLENDAIEYSLGKVRPLNEALAMYL